MVKTGESLDSVFGFFRSVVLNQTTRLTGLHSTSHCLFSCGVLRLVKERRVSKTEKTSGRREKERERERERERKRSTV